MAMSNLEREYLKEQLDLIDARLDRVERKLRAMKWVLYFTAQSSF